MIRAMSTQATTIARQERTRQRRSEAMPASTWLASPRLMSLPSPGWRRTLLVFFGIWVGVTVWRFEVISLPPYYDQATGLFVEANYLVETNFDYAALRQQPRWSAGGPAVYVISIGPTLLALLMTFAPASYLAIFHLFNFACAAAIAMLVYALIVPRAGRPGAALTALALLTVPAFNVQIDMLGLDLPVVVLALTSTLLIARERYSLAVVCGAFAFAMKTSGRAVSLAVLCYLLALLIAAAPWKSPRFRRKLGVALALSVIVVFAEFKANRWLAAQPGSAAENWEAIVAANNVATLSDDTVLSVGLRHLGRTPDWFPDQVLLFAVALASSVALLGLGLYRLVHKSKTTLVELVQAIGRFVYGHATLVVSWIVIMGSLAAFTHAYCLPRYFSLLLPFLYVVVGTLFFASVRLRPFFVAIVFALCVFNVANTGGALSPDFDSFGRTGAVLERSREYLTEHRSNIDAIHQIAERYDRVPVIAGRPYTEFLALPKLGYVDHPHEGYTVNPLASPQFRPLERLLDDLPREVIVVSAINALTPPGTLPRPQPGDEILYNDQHSSSLIVFKRSWPADTPRDQIRLGYRSMFWPADVAADEAERLFETQHYAEAEAKCREVLASHPNHAAISLILAAIVERRGEHEAAHSLLEKVVRKAPSHVEARRLLAEVCIKQGSFDQAVEQLRRVLILVPDDGRAAQRLGDLLLGLGRTSDAKGVFSTRTQRDPDDAMAHLRLAQVHETSGQAAEAMQHYRRTLELRPEWPTPANNLAWLLSTHPDASLRDGDEAVRLAQAASERTGFQDALTLDTLAAAHAECGDFETAASTATQAVALANNAQTPDVAQRISERLSAYQQHQPWRDPSWNGPSGQEKKATSRISLER